VPATIFLIANAPGRSAAFWWDRPDLPGSPAGPERRRYLEDLRGDEQAILDATRLRDPVPVAHPCLHPAAWHTIGPAVGRGIDLGVHSATHRSLPQLSDEELQREIVTSREIIERETGARPDSFAYPYGLWDERVRGAVRAAGYRAAVTLDPGPNSRGSDLWALRRVNVPGDISPPAFRAWTASLNPRWRWA
jgi:peptidoglycan/xylan/chitin deacetylase (PgdA/CDA1 family)